MWLALLLVGSPGLWIGSATDCPSAAQVREQIAPLLPAGMTVVDTSDAPTPADADRGDVIVEGGERRVRLHGPDERYNHERALAASLSCAEAARTAAVLLAAWEFQGRADARADGERDVAANAAPSPEDAPKTTLIDLDRSPPPVAPPKERATTTAKAPNPPPAKAPNPAPAISAPPVRPATTTEAAPAAPRGASIRRRLALGGGIWAGARTDRLVAAAAAEATFGPAAGLGWRLQVATTTRDSLPLGGGQAVWTRTSVALGSSITQRFGRFGLQAHGDLLGALFSISGEGLAGDETGNQLAVGVGVGARGMLALGAGDLWLDVTATAWPGRHQVLLRGANQSADLPGAELGAGVGVDFSVWP